MKRIIHRTTTKKKNKISPITHIPKELIGEVLARVASSFLDDIHNAKLSCKIFNQVGSEYYVYYKHSSLEKLSIVLWKKQGNKASFFNKCMDCENPEALYRQGVVDYFSNSKIESSLESLNKATSLGHLGALYALGIISLFGGDECKQAGMEILIQMMTSNSMRIRECRMKLKSILQCIWIRNQTVLQQRPRCCLKQEQQTTTKPGFKDWDEDDINLSCDACRCDRELATKNNIIISFKAKLPK